MVEEAFVEKAQKVKKQKAELSRFQSKFRWFVTGTPFKHARSLIAALKVSVIARHLNSTAAAESSYF